jgi:hypothetical protein
MDPYLPFTNDRSREITRLLCYLTFSMEENSAV